MVSDGMGVQPDRKRCPATGQRGVGDRALSRASCGDYASHRRPAILIEIDQSTGHLGAPGIPHLAAEGIRQAPGAGEHIHVYVGAVDRQIPIGSPIPLDPNHSTNVGNDVLKVAGKISDDPVIGEPVGGPLAQQQVRRRGEQRQAVDFD